MPDGTELVNIPPPSPEESDSDDEHSPDEYDNFQFSIGRSMGGVSRYHAWTRLPTNRVYPPRISARPIRYSTDPRRVPGVFSFARHYEGSYQYRFQWNVFYHCPPCAAALTPGNTDLAYPDHAGPPLWVPYQRHGAFRSYRCNCRICRRRSFPTAEGGGISRHLWAFSAVSSTLWAPPAPLDPKYLIMRIADWVFHHESEARQRTVRPNAGPNNWIVGPVPSTDPEHQVYKQWFYYNTPEDPTFGRRPTVYLPVRALQLQLADI